MYVLGKKAKNDKKETNGANTTGSTPVRNFETVLRKF